MGCCIAAERSGAAAGQPSRLPAPIPPNHPRCGRMASTAESVRFFEDNGYCLLKVCQYLSALLACATHCSRRYTLRACTRPCFRRPKQPPAGKIDTNLRLRLLPGQCGLISARSTSCCCPAQGGDLRAPGDHAGGLERLRHEPGWRPDRRVRPVAEWGDDGGQSVAGVGVAGRPAGRDGRLQRGKHLSPL